jgi:predicted secreted protein
MAIVNISSVDIDLSVNGSLIGCAQSMSLDEKVDTTSAACRASGKWKESVAGVNSFSASLDGLVRVTSGTDIPLNTTYKELTDLKDAGVPVTIAYGPALKGAYRRTGNALITGISTKAGDSGFATFSLTLDGTGPLAWVQNP